jgi:hypothetical protein
MELRGEYLSVSQVADRVRRNPASIRRTIQMGNAPGAIKVGETWLIPKERLADGTFTREPGRRKTDRESA